MFQYSYRYYFKPPVLFFLVQVGAIMFSELSRLLFNLDSYSRVQDIEDGIRNATYMDGTTNTGSALRAARREMFREDRGDRPDRHNVVIFITDGQTTPEFANTTEPEAQRLHDDDVTIFALGVTNNITISVLETIASEPYQEHVYQVVNFFELDYIISRLTYYLCRKTNG